MAALKTMRVLIVALLLVCLSGGQGAADSGSGGDDLDPQAVERAQQAFNDGAAFYFEEEYSRALVEFRRAHEALPHPIFLFNMALCHRELGQVGRTLQTAKEARVLFEEFYDQGQDVPLDLWARTDALILGIRAVERSAQMVEAASVVARPDVGAADSAFGLLGWAGVGALAIGAGALGGAAMIDRQVASGIEELQAISDEGEFQSQRESLAGQQTSGQVLLFSGLGLAAVGTALVVVDLVGGGAEDGDRDLVIAPSLGRPGLDIMVRW